MLIASVWLFSFIGSCATQVEFINLFTRVCLLHLFGSLALSVAVQHRLSLLTIIIYYILDCLYIGFGLLFVFAHCLRDCLCCV